MDLWRVIVHQPHQGKSQGGRNPGGPPPRGAPCPNPHPHGCGLPRYPALAWVAGGEMEAGSEKFKCVWFEVLQCWLVISRPCGREIFQFNSFPIGTHQLRHTKYSFNVNPAYGSRHFTILSRIVKLTSHKRAGISSTTSFKNATNSLIHCKL